VNIPYSKIMVPTSVKLTLYPTREVDDMVLMWYHPTGARPDYEPYSRIQLQGEVPWLHYATEALESTCPYRDFYENLFDTAHIQQLHGSAGQPEIASIERTPFGLKVSFAPVESAEQFAVTRMECNFSGVSLVTHLMEGAGFGLLLVSSATPIDRERFRQASRVFVRDTGSKEANASIAGAFSTRVNFELGQDARVLNFKKHLVKPNLCADDGPIFKWRNYQNEFYG